MEFLVRAANAYRMEGAREFAKRARDTWTYRGFRHVPLPSVSVRLYLCLREAVLRERYVDGNPLALHTVDPQDVEFVSGNARTLDGEGRLQWGLVEGGDWDRSRTRFWDLPIPASISDHYRDGVPWEETPLRERFGDFVQKPNCGWGHDSVESFETRVEQIEQLVEQIRADGYRSKRELSRDVRIESNDPVPPILDEVTVDVARDGTLRYRDFGQHRLAIAKLLDLPEIPVLVGSLHEEFVDSGADRPRQTCVGEPS